MRVSLFRLLVIALALLTVAGCASTSLSNAWRDPAYQGRTFKRLLVVGISAESGVRRTFEDEFSRSLRESGVDAVPSYILLPRDGKVEDAELRAAVAKSGADGVLMTRLVRLDRRTQVSPGYVSVLPAYGYYGSFYPYYGASFAYYGPPMVTQYDVAVLETNLWNAREEHLVWSAMTETVSPDNVRKATTDLAKVVIESLRAEKLI
jgi:hypothetical protein